MLSIATARALREAGLTWKPAELDFFAIPDRGLDERTFVINDLPASTADLLGEAIITFDGAVEWALDYVPSGEVLPTAIGIAETIAAGYTFQGRLLRPALVTLRNGNGGTE